MIVTLFAFYVGIALAFALVRWMFVFRVGGTNVINTWLMLSLFMLVVGTVVIIFVTAP